MKKVFEDVFSEARSRLVSLIADEVERNGGMLKFPREINSHYVHGRAIDLETIVSLHMVDGECLVHNFITDGNTLDVDEHYTPIEHLSLDELRMICEAL